MLVMFVVTTNGCYRFAPAASVPEPGTSLVVDLNDRGRVVLGDSIGPSATRIEGRVAASSPDSYLLEVASVQYLNGQSNRWSGEKLSIGTDLMERVRERQYSRSRTFLAGLGIAAAIAAVVIAVDLAGLGTFETDPPTPPPPPPVN